MAILVECPECRYRQSDNSDLCSKCEVKKKEGPVACRNCTTLLCKKCNASLKKFSHKVY